MSKFLPYILNLRGAAIFFVVGVHARGNLSDWDSHTLARDFVRSLFDANEGNGTVMFIFIGGFLFQHLTQEGFEFRKYVEKKFQYVILPYILISIPIVAYRIYTNYNFGLPPGFNDQSVFYQLFYYLATGLHMAPFWFISAIMLFYLSSPLLHALDRPKVYQYVFPVLFIVCLFTYRSAHNANPILSYLHYFPVYFAGMWASYNKEKILAKANWLLYPLLFIYLSIYVAESTKWIPIPERITFEEILKEGTWVFNISMFKASVLCFALMLLLYKLRKKRLPFLEILGEYSFGIFFVHCIFIYLSRKLWLVTLGPMDFSLLTYLIYFAFILLVSTGTVYFIKKLTGRYSRHLIGS